MHLHDQLDHHGAMSCAAHPFRLHDSEHSPLVSQQKEGRHSGLGFLLAMKLLPYSVDVPLVEGAELIQLLLLLQGEQGIFIGSVGGTPPTLQLKRVQTMLAKVLAELGVIEHCGLQHHLEFVGSRAVPATATPS